MTTAKKASKKSTADANDLLSTARDMTREMHARAEREDQRNATETRRNQLLKTLAVVLLFLAVVGAAGSVIGAINIVQGRHENASRSADRKAQLDKLTVIAEQNKALAAKIDSVTDPNGCVAMRGAQNLAAALAVIDNNNRDVHHLPPNPVPTVSTKPCPGEPGGEPLTTTTTVPKHEDAKGTTKSTVQTALPPTKASGSGSGT